MKIIPLGKILRLQPETIQEAFSVGALKGGQIDPTLPGVVEFTNDALNIRGDWYECLARQLRAVDDILQWQGTGCGRVDRINQLLDIEDEYKVMMKDVKTVSV